MRAHTGTEAGWEPAEAAGAAAAAAVAAPAAAAVGGGGLSGKRWHRERRESSRTALPPLTCTRVTTPGMLGMGGGMASSCLVRRESPRQAEALRVAAEVKVLRSRERGLEAAALELGV